MAIMMTIKDNDNDRDSDDVLEKVTVILFRPKKPEALSAGSVGIVLKQCVESLNACESSGISLK